MREVLGKVKKGVLDALFPAICVGCGKSGSYVCERCTLFLVEAELVCPQCLRESATGEVHISCQKQGALDGLVSVWEYEGLMKTLFRTVVEGGVSHALEETMELAFLRLAQERERYATFFQTLLSCDTAITLIPLSLKMQRRQGFDQSLLVAKALGQVARKKALPLFKKFHDDSAPDDWSQEQKREMPGNSLVFQETPQEMFSREVIVVDGLWRNGATLHEAASLLKRAGVEKVWGFTLARVV